MKDMISLAIAMLMGINAYLSFTYLTMRVFLLCLFHSQGNKKTLVLREIPEDGVKTLLSHKESLAGCDVAVFVYDR